MWNNEWEVYNILGLLVSDPESQLIVEASFPLVYKYLSLESLVDKLTKLVKPDQALKEINIT